MSPAEARFVRLMGGKVSTFGRVKDRSTHFPLTMVWSLGKILKSEGFKREVRYGRYFVDFANDLNRIIEIDGSPYHMDVVADMKRDEYIKDLCRKWDISREAKILRIPAHKIKLDAENTHAKVLKFIRDGHT